MNATLAIGILDWIHPQRWLDNPWMFLVAGFQIWMLVDAIRREEWLWAFFIFIFPVLNAVLYFFLVYRASGSVTRTSGFEFPGAATRARIHELQEQIHHLDKAHHHSQLGDVYFRQGKLDEAEKCYRAALERDAEDRDTRAHFAQCLLRQGKVQEALPLLEAVCREDGNHDYGHSLMALAETYAALGRKSDAADMFRKVLELHTYARARVQLAELLAEAGEKGAALKEADEVIVDVNHAPSYQRSKDRIWVRRAKVLKSRLS